ncbi:MAG: PIN domain-containing protein [Burkholderiaceae bacterium]|nr:PIN domain-containing protein [Burkholderiaceae bacterium]
MRVELRWPLADAAPGARALVLDTNIVLDLLVFNDPAIAPVRQLLADGALRWIATPVMRDELARVLAYPQIVPRLAFYGLGSAAVLQAYEAQVQWCDVPPRVPAACKDADDQKFIDLAAAHQAVLLSKDKAVICMRKRLLAQGAQVATALVMASDTAPPPLA